MENPEDSTRNNPLEGGEEAVRPSEQPEQLPEQKPPESIIEEFETATAAMKGQEEGLTAQIRDKEELKELNEQMRIAGLEKVNQAIDRDVTALEQQRQGIQEEIAARNPPESENDLQAEIQNIEGSIGDLQRRKEEGEKMRVPTAIIAAIESDISKREEQKRAITGQLKGMKLKRIQEYTAAKEQGVRREKIRESAKEVVQAEEEKKLEAREVVEKKERWGWLKNQFKRAAPFGIYHAIQERKAVREAAKSLAGQIKFARERVLAGMSQEGMHTGFKSIRTCRAELSRIEKELKKGKEKGTIKDFNDVREGTGKGMIELNNRVMDEIVENAAKILVANLEKVRNKNGERVPLDETRLADFKEQMRIRLARERNQQVVMDAKQYAKLVKKALDPRYWETGVYRVLKETAQESAWAA